VHIRVGVATVSCGRGRILLQQQGEAGAAHHLREDGGRQRQLVGHAAVAEDAAAVLTLFLETRE